MFGLIDFFVLMAEEGREKPRGCTLATAKMRRRKSAATRQQGLKRSDDDDNAISMCSDLMRRLPQAEAKVHMTCASM
jgi:hypothetical protein